jgi:rare lipoprotein A
MQLSRVVAVSAVVLLVTPISTGMATQADTTKKAHPAKSVHHVAKQRPSGGKERASRPSGKASRHTVQITKKCLVSADGERGFSGIASIYAAEGISGDGADDHGLTAAHCTLPFGTRVLVTNVTSGSSVIVTIRDRGPFVRGRILDLSPGAARAIGLTKGVLRIKAEVMQDFPFWELRWPEKPAT